MQVLHIYCLRDEKTEVSRCAMIPRASPQVIQMRPSQEFIRSQLNPFHIDD
jgi:hypothetical protein